MAIDAALLAAALRAPQVEQRLQAAQTLAEAGAAASLVAVPLVVAAGDDVEEVRQWASAALEELGPPAATDLAPLVEQLQKPSPDTAYWAATLLGRLGADAGPATRALAASLAESRPLPVRQRAAWALGEIGPAARDAEASLEAATRAADSRLRRLATDALARIREHQ